MTDLAALAAIVELTYETRAALIDGQLGEPVFPEAVQVVRIGKREFTVAIAPYDGGNLAIVDERRGDRRGRRLVAGRQAAGRRHGRAQARIVQVAKKGRGWTLTTRGAAHQVLVMPRHIAELARHMIEKVPPDMSRFLLAPMPGLLTRLEVKAGDKVEAGQPVAVVEAMKMENILRAEKSARSRRPRPRPATAWRSIRSSWSLSEQESSSGRDPGSACFATVGSKAGGRIKSSWVTIDSSTPPAAISPSPSWAARRQTRFRGDICMAQSLPSRNS